MARDRSTDRPDAGPEPQHRIVGRARLPGRRRLPGKQELARPADRRGSRNDRARPEDVQHQTRQQYWPKNISGTASSKKTFATGLRIGTREAVWRPEHWQSESLQPKPGMRLATISYERRRNGMTTGFADPVTTETAAYSVETVGPMIERAALALEWKNSVPSLEGLLATVAGWKNGETGPVRACATHGQDTLRVEQLEVREGSETAEKVNEYLRRRPATARRR